MQFNSNTTMIVVWGSYLAVVIYLANSLDAVAIPFAAIMMVPLIVMTNLIYKSGGASSVSSSSDVGQEKRKRERIDNMIRDMSDEELYELRQRLQTGAYDMDDLYDRVVGDDGELMRK